MYFSYVQANDEDMKKMPKSLKRVQVHVADHITQRVDHTIGWTLPMTVSLMKIFKEGHKIKVQTMIHQNTWVT